MPGSSPDGFGTRQRHWITVPSVFTVTGTVQKEAWDRNVVPPVEKVRPGMWSVPVPIPNNPLRYVSVYVLELDNGIALVDAGWPTDDAWDALNAGLLETGGSMSDVRAVVVTHLHPDHYGLAGRVREASGAWVGLHPADAKLLDARYHDTDALVDRMQELLAMSGVPEDKLPDLAFASMEVKATLDVALPDVLIEDDQIIDLPGWDFRAVWTPGHSPGHICLYSDEQKLLLSGDHAQHLVPLTTVRQSARRLPRVAGQGPGVAPRRGLPRPRVSLRRAGGSGRRPHETSRRSPARDRGDPPKDPGNLLLGHHALPFMVAAVGRHPRLHAKGGQR
jgi:glyoxylase-like metal-dependent hydrolase (beta-lactamase superfamily II)